MTPERALQRLKKYKDEVSQIGGRFKDTGDALRIASGDDSKLHQIVIEVRDLFDDLLGQNTYSSMVVNAYENGRRNYIQSPSRASVSQIESIVAAAVTRFSDNPDIIRSRGPQKTGVEMGAPEMLDKLNGFKERFRQDVMEAYSQRGDRYGEERFASWKTQFSKFLREAIPSALPKLQDILDHPRYAIVPDESDLVCFMRALGDGCLALIDSLKIDIQNGELPDATDEVKFGASVSEAHPPRENKRVFIVHGHDELLRTKAARLVEGFGLEAIVLHEVASKGLTIIEKIEEYSDVGFAIVLYTADDEGRKQDAVESSPLMPRARQNVVFEHGYLIAKLGRSRVAPLVASNIELPGDISGVVYVSDANWQLKIAQEMKAVGYEIDFGKIRL
jgi:predicted nucleotide-binding protein